MTSAEDRFKPGSCPGWCHVRHTGWDIELGGEDGPRWLSVQADDGNSFDIGTAQNEYGEVVVWVGAVNGSMLTSEQARVAAGQLLEAASWAEDHAIPDI
jgi:hypothetical protein